jgi:hypothetical protein
MADIDLIRALASWALVHEMADEGWKAAVDRGMDPALSGSGEPRDVVDGISALVYREKERLKAELTAGDGLASTAATGQAAPGSEVLEELRFEVGEVRGRLESIETALDALIARLDARDAG